MSLKKNTKNEENSLEKENSKKQEQFQSLMHLNSNILNAISKTNNRYNSKEELKSSTRGTNFQTLKESNNAKNKKNNKNSMTINLMKEKAKFSNTISFNSFQKDKQIENHVSHLTVENKVCANKHKKNSVSVLGKKEIFSCTMKTPEKNEKNYVKLEAQMNILKKKVDVLENQNKNFKQQLCIISEEKNLYIKVQKTSDFQ